ncbi:MAG: pilus assembly FimT family protein [Nitrospirota bacterium]
MSGDRVNTAMSKSPWGERGFTLIETVIVIAIVALVAILAIPKLPDLLGVKASATARKLQSDLAYVQGLSMTTNTRHRLVFLSTTTYEVRDAAGTLVVNPDGRAGFSIATASGITLSWSLNGVTVVNRGVEFDTLGRPYLYAGSTPSATNLTTGTITVTGGGDVQTVTIRDQTGMVSIP